MMLSPIRWTLALIALVAMPAPSWAETPAPMYAIAMHGEPALPPDFTHLPYVHPDAPKGGRLDLAYLGAFDSLNPYNIKALSTAQGLNGNVCQTRIPPPPDQPCLL